LFIEEVHEEEASFLFLGASFLGEVVPSCLEVPCLEVAFLVAFLAAFLEAYLEAGDLSSVVLVASFLVVQEVAFLEAYPEEEVLVQALVAFLVVLALAHRPLEQLEFLVPVAALIEVLAHQLLELGHSNLQELAS